MASSDTTTGSDWFAQNAPASGGAFTYINPATGVADPNYHPPVPPGLAGPAAGGSTVTTPGGSSAGPAFTYVNPATGKPDPNYKPPSAYPNTTASPSNPALGGSYNNIEDAFTAFINGNPQYQGGGQAAIDAFGKQYPQYNGVVSWDPNTSTYGLPSGYLTNLNGSGWSLTPRGSDTSGVGSYSALQRPADVSSPYTPAVWSDTYTVPTIDDLLNSPGYQADATAVQRGMERGAAAKGSLLSGGFIGRTLPTALANFTSTAYNNLNNQNFQAYQQRYNQFLDTNNQTLGARQLNENDYNTDVTNNLNQYLTRYGAYQDLIKNNLSYANLGLSATTAGAPTSAGTGA